MGSNDEQNSTEKNFNVSITVRDEKHILLASSIQETLPKKGSHVCSIYRVFGTLRTGNELMFNARVVSIGPYQRTRKDLMVTENHKRWYLHNLIERFLPARPSLPNILKAMKDLETEARECYAEETDILSDEFVTMMMVDGCFMLELFYKYRETVVRCRTAQNRENESRDRIFSSMNEDVIFSSENVIRRIQMDFVCLENQLPMVVLNCLFELTKDRNDSCSLKKLIMDFLEDILPTKLIQTDDPINGKHLLDLVRNAIIPLPDHLYGKQYPRYNTGHYSASQLHEAGVKLKVNEEATSLMDIKFDTETGVLKIPNFLHGRCLAMLIPNLIALEKIHLPYTKEITSYALFLNTLANTKEDVKLLYDGGIIYDGGCTDDVTRTEEEISNEINTMCAGIVGTKMFYYKDLCDNINRYCKIRWRPKIKRIFHRSMLILFRDYFNSPWRILSLLAAIMLLVLTLMQTIYSVRSYSRRV